MYRYKRDKGQNNNWGKIYRCPDPMMVLCAGAKRIIIVLCLWFGLLVIRLDNCGVRIMQVEMSIYIEFLTGLYCNIHISRQEKKKILLWCVRSAM